MTDQIAVGYLDYGVLGLTLLVCFAVIVGIWRWAIGKDEKLEAVNNARIIDLQRSNEAAVANAEVLRELAAVIEKANQDVKELQREVRDLRISGANNV